MQKPTITLILFATELIILASLILISVGLYRQTASVATQQSTNLASMQDEYDNSDLTLLDGTTVTAAKAISIVRKYIGDSNITIYRNGTALVAGGQTISKNLFSENSQWQIATESNSNGVVNRIYFTSPSDNDDPTGDGADEAKAWLAAVLGVNASTSWTDLKSKLEDLLEADDYRQQFCSQFGLSTEATWEEVYTEFEKQIATYQDSTVHYCEEVTLEVNSTASYGLSSFSYAILKSNAKYALLVVSGNSFSIYGDIDEGLISIDFTAQTIDWVNNDSWNDDITFMLIGG